MSYDTERTVTSIDQSTPSLSDFFRKTPSCEDSEADERFQLLQQREDDLLKSYGVLTRQLDSMKAEIDKSIETGKINQSDIEFILSVTECSLKAKIFAQVLERVFVYRDDYMPTMIYEPIIEITRLACEISRPDNKCTCANTAELRELTAGLLCASIEVLQSLVWWAAH
jgi:hypothetical protein